MLTEKAHNQIRQNSFMPFTPVSRAVLQRKCACGTHTMGGGECGECQGKKLGVGGQPLQTKLAISEQGDAYEQEADRVAEQVMRMPAMDLGIERNGNMPQLQRRASVGTSGLAEAPPAVHKALNSSGQPLDAAARAFFEPRFGHDFSRVRVHSGGDAELSAQDVNAHAYTMGHNIVFGAGQFAPGTHEGRRLIAHELAHVVQQGSGQVGSGSIIQLQGRPFVPSRALWNIEEAEAAAKKERCAKLADKERRAMRHGTPLTWAEEWDYISCPDTGLSAKDIVHHALAIAGFAPVLGAIPDGIDAAIYVLEGDWASAGLSAVAMFPGWGDGVKVGAIGGKSAILISEKAALRLGEEGIAKGLKEVQAASKAVHAAEEGATQMRKTTAKKSTSLPDWLEPTAHPPTGSFKTPRPRGFDTGRTGPGRKVRAGTAEGLKPTAYPPINKPRKKGPTREQQLEGIAIETDAQVARDQFKKVRDEYRAKLGAKKRDDIHHAIELDVLDRYPGAYTGKELNDFKNMRGIPQELAKKKQLHNSKIRELWDRAYKQLDADILERGLQKGTPGYNEHVRRSLEHTRDYIDWVIQNVRVYWPDAKRN